MSRVKSKKKPKVDWEAVRECLQEWLDSTASKLTLLTDVASNLAKEAESNPDSPISYFMSVRDLSELAHTLSEAECCLMNLQLRPLIHDAEFPDPLKCDCLRKAGA